MAWWQFALLGAGGGLIVEALAVFRWCAVWQAARRTKSGRLRSKPPGLRTYVDAPTHVWLAACRAVLGAATVAPFGASGQITGSYAAVALGMCAPAVLAQLGSVPQIAQAVSGAGARAADAGQQEAVAAQSGTVPGVVGTGGEQ